MSCEERRYTPAELTRVYFRACAESPGPWTLLEQTISITPPNPSTETVKYTVLTDNRQRKRAGKIPDEGQAKVKFQFNAENQSQQLWFEFFYSGETFELCVAFEPPAEGDDPEGPTFAGFIKTLEPNELSENTDLEYDSTVEIDGDVEWPQLEEVGET